MSATIALPTRPRVEEIGFLGVLAGIALMAMSSARIIIQQAPPTSEPPSADFCEDIHNAASASRTDVNTAIAAADAGDCVVVPSDSSESWAGGVTISGISLIGPGKGAGSPTNITAGLVTITKHATDYTRLIGFRFTGTDQHLEIGGTGKPFVVHNNHFEVTGTEWSHLTTNGGLFSDNRAEADTPTSADVFRINLGGPGGAGLTSWQAATTFGDDDTTGETNTYFENNEWVNLLEIVVDCDNGARIAMRHELFQDSSVTMHGGGNGDGGQDTSSYGCRQLSIANSTFDRVDTSSAAPVNKWVWARGSVVVLIGNSFDENSTEEYPNKPELQFSVGCPGNPGYPMPYQFGQTTQTPDPTPDQPSIVYNNTGTGQNVTISGDNGEDITCSVPNDYIQSGRDYVTTNSWGYAEYTYPHPLHPSIDGSGDL